MKKSKSLITFILLVVLALSITACTNSANENEQQPTEDNTEPNLEEESTSFIYTANEGGSISKIDLATYEVIETIEDEGMPHNVQVSPDGKIVAYTSAMMMEDNQTDHGSMNMNGSAVFYDTETDELIKKVEVGSHPAHIVFTEDGKYVLVTNYEDDNVSIIDAQSYEIVNTVTVGNGPHGFRISPDSKFAYIANLDEDTISVVDIDNNKEVKKIKVGSGPVTTAITSDGKKLIVTISSDNSMAIVDLDTEEIEKVEVGEGPIQVYLTTDDKYALVANQGTEDNPSNTISKVDLTTKEVVNIEAENGPHGVVISSDDQYVFVTNMYDDSVSVIDNSNNEVIQTIPVGETPNGISFKK